MRQDLSCGLEGSVGWRALWGSLSWPADPCVGSWQVGALEIDTNVIDFARYGDAHEQRVMRL